MLLPTKTRKISVTITTLAASARPRSTALAQAVQGRWSRVEVGGFVLPRDFLGVSGGVMVRRASKGMKSAAQSCQNSQNENRRVRIAEKRKRNPYVPFICRKLRPL